MFKRLTLWKRVLGAPGGVARPTLMYGMYVSEWAGEQRWEGGRAASPLRVFLHSNKEQLLIGMKPGLRRVANQFLQSYMQTQKFRSLTLPSHSSALPDHPTSSAPLLNDIQSKRECRYF